MVFSIVISSLNGEHRIGRALTSLLAQSYPADQYEIIVVDDGSADKTAEVAAGYPNVKVIRHTRNLGIAAARNSGLKAARGQIYVCFDDDCEVAPDWLKRLAEAYATQPTALGIGSIIVPPAQPKGLITKFMAAVGSGNPTPLSLGQSKQPLSRFFAYLKDQVTPPTSKIGQKLYEVRHLNGATASFDRAALVAVHGWNSQLHWMEDTDVCSRLADHFPQRSFYAEPTAQIIHDPHMSLSTFLKRPFRRGPFNLAYYQSQKLVPPVFPFPLFWLFAVILCLWLSPIIGLISAVILPQILYFWWPVRAWREHQAIFGVFPYLQLSEELSTVAGIARGYLMGTPKHEE